MATKKKPAARKNVRSTPKPKAKKKTTSSKAPTAKSVDSLLKKFEKERVTLDSKVVSARKKIETMTKKISAMKTELEATKRTLVETELAIETVDARRDKEIGAMLHGLGVNLDKAASAAKVKPPVEVRTPLFEVKSGEESTQE